MIKRLLLISALWLGLAAPVAAQINGGSPIYTFSPNTVISSTEVNANFAALFSDALNRTGGTFTGALNGGDATFTGIFTVTDLVGSDGTFDTLGVGTLTVSTAATLPTATTIGSVSATELGYVDGATSNIQDQLDSLSSSIGGISVTGRIVQIVSATNSTEQYAYSTSLTSTGLTATITPTSATSKLLVMVQQGITEMVAGICAAYLRRDNNVVVAQTTPGNGSGPMPMFYVATAGSANATTFDVQWRSLTANTSTRCWINPDSSGLLVTNLIDQPHTSWMIILEINQ